MSLPEKAIVLNKEKEVIEAKTEHLAMQGKWDERKIHAYSMLAIRVGAIILAIAIVIVILMKGR